MNQLQNGHLRPHVYLGPLVSIPKPTFSNVCDLHMKGRHPQNLETNDKIDSSLYWQLRTKICLLTKLSNYVMFQVHATVSFVVALYFSWMAAHSYGGGSKWLCHQGFECNMW